MPEYPPQTPGEVKIHLTPGSGSSVIIDGYDLTQHATAIKVMFSAKDRRPVLLVDLLPSTIDLTGTNVKLDGDFRDFLIAHGWRPPE